MKTNQEMGVRGWVFVAATVWLGACADDADTSEPKQEVEVDVVAAFDAASFELPEGLSIAGGDAYVGMALSATIERVSLQDGSREVVANLPVPMPDTGFMTGLGQAPDGQLHAALVSFTGDPAPGVYRVVDGQGELFAAHESMVFPNGLAWGARGELYVTDSAAGAVFVTEPSGETTEWFRDDLLALDTETCGGSTTGIAVGANGIVYTDGALVITSSELGAVVRVPVHTGGAPGAMEVIAGPDCELAGLDGITLDADGSFIGAVNRTNRLVRISATGGVTTIHQGPPLDFPASPELAGDGSLYVTSFAVSNALAGMPAAPSLVHLRF